MRQSQLEAQNDHQAVRDYKAWLCHPFGKAHLRAG